MRTEIYIENQSLDLREDISHLLTYALDDIKDFSSRNCAFSKTIVLPGTARNNKLFGDIFNVTISNAYNATGDNVLTNFNPSVASDCLIFVDRLQVFKGTLRLLEIIIDKRSIEYEVAVFGELGGLVLSLGNNKLEDLDFSAYDQDYTAANVTGSWDQLNATGICWPLIDYGTVSTNKVDYDIKAFRPAFYVREILDKIITEAGYSWECDLFNTARFKSLIVPNNQRTFQRRTSNIFHVAVSEAYYLMNTGGGPVSPQFTTWLNEIYLGSFTSSGGSTRYTYTGTDTIVGAFHMTMNFDFAHDDSQPTLTLELYKNGVFLFQIGEFQTGTNINAEILGDNFTINQNDYFEIKATVTPTAASTYYVYVNSGEWEIRTAADVWSDIAYGEDVEVNDSLPRNVLQKDFLASIVKLFNLYIYEDTLYTKKLLIKPYVDFYDLNVSGVVDWTYKVDRSRPFRLRPMSELNSRYYNFKFKLDGDYYNELYNKTHNETYGDYIYDSDYQFAGEKTDVELIFASSVLVGYAGTDKLVSAFYKKNAGVEERYSTVIRILQFKKVTGVTAWDILNGVSVLLNDITIYGYAGHYDDPDAPSNDIHFGVPRELYFTLVSGAVNVTQFNVYWSPYMAEITDKDSKMLTCFLKLDGQDIFNLDFSKLVYIDGSYFRINKIEDWDVINPDVCKGEFLKVINLIY